MELYNSSVRMTDQQVELHAIRHSGHVSVELDTCVWSNVFFECKPVVDNITIDIVSEQF